MEKPTSEIPESKRQCPFCEAEGTPIRVLKYGSNNSQEQVKFECPECDHSWFYHSDDK